MSPSDGNQANQQMVDRLIADGSLWSPRLIAAFRATPRHRFLDRFFQYQRKRHKPSDNRPVLVLRHQPTQIRRRISQIGDCDCLAHRYPRRESPNSANHTIGSLGIHPRVKA